MASQLIDKKRLAGMSVADRLKLIELIAQSLRAAKPGSEGLSPEQKQEMDRRLAAFRSNPSRAMSRSEFKKKLRSLT
jgi:putative addiction module component (TIGR02574 family)